MCTGRWVNEIANRAYLHGRQQHSRYRTRSRLITCRQSRQSIPVRSQKQFIPMDPALWKVERYEDFLKARAKLLARKLNEHLAAR